MNPAEIQLKLNCISLAVSSNVKDPEEIMNLAEKFYDFVNFDGKVLTQNITKSKRSIEDITIEEA